MAPEVMTGMKTKHVEKCDVFSLGILSFIMLFGHEPFSHSYSGYWFTLIKLKKWNDFWRDRNASEEFQKFFERMIDFDHENRFSLNEAIENEWLK
jgi:serine/threonine-protein kinase ULK/ATG1/calcium/calmodulin-dependent protein kinase I